MTLYDLSPDEKGLIIKIKGSGAFRKRLIDMGFIRGRVITVVKKAPLQDPIQYELMGYEVSLRGEEARQIEVIDLKSQITGLPDMIDFIEVTTSESSGSVRKKAEEKIINVVLVGNPNSGKTTIFNNITGLHEKVGNYPGVTVDAKITQFRYRKYKIKLIDLPGTYSISAYTPEEIFVRKFLTSEKTDIIVNVVDSSNLARNLYLTTQLLDLDLNIVLCLNMYDELIDSGDEFAHKHFSEMLGVPAVPVVGKKKEEVNRVLEKIIQVHENNDPMVRHIHIHYGTIIEGSIEKLEKEIIQSNSFPAHVHPRFIALKLLEKDVEYFHQLNSNHKLANLKHLTISEIEYIEDTFSEDTATYLADLRYGFIEGALKETYKKKNNIHKEKTTTRKLDEIFTHKIWGLPILLLFMWLMFYSTFEIGGIFMKLIDTGVGFAGNMLLKYMSDSIFRDIVIEGVISGVGAVIIFFSEYYYFVYVYCFYGRYGLHVKNGFYYGQTYA